MAFDTKVNGLLLRVVLDNINDGEAVYGEQVFVRGRPKQWEQREKVHAHSDPDR